MRLFTHSPVYYLGARPQALPAVPHAAPGGGKKFLARRSLAKKKASKKNRESMSTPPSHVVLSRLEARAAAADATHCSSEELTRALAGLSPADVDSVLLLLKISPETGDVDYSRLRDEVAIDQRKAGLGIKALPQEELVYRIMKDLRVLYNKYDQAEITQRGLREGLANLGLTETFALKELLSRKALDLTFQEFVAALARVDENSARGAGANEYTGGHPRFATSKSLGIFDANRPDHNSNALNVRGRLDASHGRESVSDDPARSPSRGLSTSRGRTYNSTGSFPPAAPAPQAYETTTQQATSPVRSREPATSAGYRTKDMGYARLPLSAYCLPHARAIQVH